MEDIENLHPNDYQCLLEAALINQKRKELTFIQNLPFASMKYKDEGRVFKEKQKSIKEIIGPYYGTYVKPAADKIKKSWELVKQAGRKKQDG